MANARAQENKQNGKNGNVVAEAWQGASGSIRQWWREDVASSIEHREVIDKVEDESGWTARYAFMTLMSAGIAILGLLLSSPAVVIGAMLISPLMGPIIGLGFGLALVDGNAIRRSLISLALGIATAIAFTALIVFFSPIKDITPEIAARTRPNLFDLMVALFSALAGTYAMMRGREGTVVGVAIATALMPPLAVIGFGIATFNWPVFLGSSLLFITNLMTIAVAAAIMARLYGFGRKLTSRQSGIQLLFIISIFLALAFPLGISLMQIAWETNAQRITRDAISGEFAGKATIDQLEIDFDSTPMNVSATIFTPNYQEDADAKTEKILKDKLGVPVSVAMEQYRVGTSEGDAEAAQLAAAMAREKANADLAVNDRMSERLVLVGGGNADSVLIDPVKKRAELRASTLPGASLETYYILEQRVRALEPKWDIRLIPPIAPLPDLKLDDKGEKLADDRQAVIAIWAAQRLQMPVILVGNSDAANALAERLRNAGINVEQQTPRRRTSNIEIKWKSG